MQGAILPRLPLCAILIEGNEARRLQLVSTRDDAGAVPTAELEASDDDEEQVDPASAPHLGQT